jgi:ribosomal protein S18 acetylase RimI-like enzyme
MQTKIKKVELRNLAFEDYKQLKDSMVESYPEMADSYWRANDIERLLGIFPEGQLVILVDGKVVGSALSLIVDEKLVDKKHNYLQIIGDYSFSTHNPNGEILYGIDVFIHPSYRGR